MRESKKERKKIGKNDKVVKKHLYTYHTNTTWLKYYGRKEGTGGGLGVRERQSDRKIAGEKTNTCTGIMK